MVAAGSPPRRAAVRRTALLSAGAALFLTSCSGTYASDSSPGTSTATATASATASDTNSTGTTAPGGAGAVPTLGSGGAVITGDTPSFTGEDLTADQSTQLQTAVDQGQQPWRLDQVMVAKAFVRAR